MAGTNSQYMMKYILGFLIFFLIGFFLIFAGKRYLALQQQGNIKTPISKAVPFSLDTPPKNSLKGTMEKTGTIYFESRSASEEAVLLEAKPVLQGEAYRTDEKASLRIFYPGKLTTILNDQTTLSIIQTIPTNFTFSQTNGTVTYEKIDPSIPVGVRALHLLISQKEGSMDVTVDADAGQVIISVTKGEVTMAFNDLELLSTVTTLQTGDAYTFDDATRTGEVSKIE